MEQEGEGAGFGGSLWLVCVHNIPCLASLGGPDHRQSAPELLSVGHTCGQNVATYLPATYSQVGLNIGHCGWADMCGIAVGCDHIFRIC